MYNELFSIGPFTIHGYGLMIGIGFIVALAVASYRAKKRGLNEDFLFNLAVLCLIFGMLGAKLLYIITVLDKIIKNPSNFPSLASGFVVYGGIISGILTGYIYCRMKGKVFKNYFDIVMPSISIAQGFGRLGCFLAGCCYGKETDAWYGITFTHSEYAPNNVSLIPTQLISSAGDFLIAGALILIARKQKKPGFIAGTYLILYGFGRFFVEMLRGDLERGSVGTFSTSQFISLFIVLIGVAYLIYIIKFTEMPESIAEAEENAESISDASAESQTAEVIEEAKAETLEENKEANDEASADNKEAEENAEAETKVEENAEAEEKTEENAEEKADDNADSEANTEENTEEKTENN